MEHDRTQDVINQPMDATDSIRDLLEQYEGPLLRYALRLTGDLETARDIVQDTFVKLIENGPASVNGYLAQWLYTVCRNRALDVRRKDRRMTLLTDEQNIASQTEAGTDPANDKATIDSSKGQMLKEMEHLPDRQREALRLKFQSGFSYKEIASVLETSVSNVGFLIHTGLKTLRERLSDVTAEVQRT